MVFLHGILYFGRRFKKLIFSFESNENTAFRQHLKGCISGFRPILTTSLPLFYFRFENFIAKLLFYLIKKMTFAFLSANGKSILHDLLVFVA